MAFSITYPETSASTRPIYKRVVKRTSSGNLGISHEELFTRDDLLPNGPDMSTPAGTTVAWYIMLKDTFEWVAMSWSVIEPCQTDSAQLNVVAAKVAGVTKDWFVQAKLTQSPTY